MPRYRAKNSSVVSRILSWLNRPIGRPAQRKTTRGEIPTSSSLRLRELETRNRFIMAVYRITRKIPGGMPHFSFTPLSANEKRKSTLHRRGLVVGLAQFLIDTW